MNVEATNESALTTIVRVLSETYTDAGVLIWLNAKNKQLRSKPDGSWSCSPAEYIAAGHAAEVLDAARRIEGSSLADSLTCDAAYRRPGPATPEPTEETP